LNFIKKEKLILNKIKNSSMFLLWAGAAISISEIYTGGLIAPLGFSKGVVAIIIGHIIGTSLLVFGGYISFLNERNAMENVKHSMGSLGVKLIAFLNVLQLVGWSAIMIIQGGRALSYVFPTLSYAIAILIMSALVFIWAYYFSNYSKWINDISVILLVFLSILLFMKIGNKMPVSISGSMSFTMAIELSIAMPVSWLPLIGDYTKCATNKSSALKYTFLGYFIGSILMFSLGLFITGNTGKDIIEFIASSYVKWVACIVIVLSTTTTTFMDIYSAAISSKQIFNTKKDNTYIIFYSGLALIVSYVFPIEKYTDFLIIIGSVFVPIYTIIFLEYLLHKKAEQKKINVFGILSATAGTIIYYYLIKYEVGIPTIISILMVTGLYFLSKKLFNRGNIA
jgi:putative hydroxymethylpyrimidine transporter CytX